MTREGLIGRDEETELLRRRIEGLAQGRGGSVLIEGEPGIGKTTVLALVAREAARLGCRILHAHASELGRSFPLRPLLDCLEEGGDAGAGTGAGTMALMERLTRRITAMTDESPLLLLLDDLNWADDATLLLWQRLSRATARLPLLLVATSRRVPGRRELSQLRRDLLDQDTWLLALAPMSPAEVARLTETLLGAAPGPDLRDRLEPAGGNPLYVRELLDALLRQDGIDVARGDAELSGDAASASPRPPLRAITERLGRLPPDTLRALRAAALLGTEFSATEFAAVLRRPPSDLLALTDEATAAGMLADTGERMTFRHPLIRQALYDSAAPPERARAHRRAAQALHAGGASVERVAEQLLHAGDATGGWMTDWVIDAAEPLALRAPEVAVDLLRRALGQVPGDDPRRAALEHRLGEAAFRLRRPECNAIVRGLLDRAADPDRRALLTVSLVLGLFWEGKWAEAMAVLDEAEAGEAEGAPDRPGPAPVWANRFRGLRSIALWSGGRPEAVPALAAQVVAEAAACGDANAEAYGRHALALSLMRRRRTDAALAENARGLAAARRVAATGPGTDGVADVRITMLVYRALMLGATDRTEEALEALREARRLCESMGAYGHLSGISMSQAALNYWSGRWDAALADLDAIADLPAVEWLPVLRYGVAVLVHGHRDQEEDARALFAELRDRPDPGGLQRGHSHYRIMAGALMAERDGRPGEALGILLPTLDPGYARELDQRHQWLPDIVRLALEVGDPATAQAAAVIAASEADQEPNAGRTAAAGRCRGLVDQDPEPLLAAVDHYTRAGRPLQAGQALEDLAAVLASLGDLPGARAQLDRAVAQYRRIGAAWDIRRAHARLRPLGVRGTARRASRRPARTGWEALTPTELKIARLVSEGRSNPGIAEELYLSPRTVQTHVSHILGKLGVRSRTEVAGEAARHPVPGPRPE